MNRLNTSSLLKLPVCFYFDYHNASLFYLQKVKLCVVNSVKGRGICCDGFVFEKRSCTSIVSLQQRWQTQSNWKWFAIKCYWGENSDPATCLCLRIENIWTPDILLSYSVKVVLLIAKSLTINMFFSIPVTLCKVWKGDTWVELTMWMLLFRCQLIARRKSLKKGQTTTNCPRIRVPNQWVVQSNDS